MRASCARGVKNSSGRWTRQDSHGAAAKVPWGRGGGKRKPGPGGDGGRRPTRSRPVGQGRSRGAQVGKPSGVQDREVRAVRQGKTGTRERRDLPSQVGLPTRRNPPSLGPPY